MEEYTEIDSARLKSRTARELYNEIFYVEEARKISNADARVDGPRLILQSWQERASRQANYIPNIGDLLDFYSSRGLVGEERVAILQTLGSIRKLCFGIEGASGSGKSFTADLLMELLPKEYVYRIELSSNTAEVYNAEEINRAKIIYVPELQKALNSKNPIMVEVLKNLTEGRDVLRRVRDQEKKRNITLHIEADKGIIYTLALENDLKKDVELSRRVFQLTTDSSEEQNYRVIDNIVEEEYNHSDKGRDFTELKQHIRSCVLLPEIEYVNPFSRALMDVIPLTVKARSFVKHYLNLIQGSALFHHKERVHETGNIFVNLEDFFLVHSLYNRMFSKSLDGGAKEAGAGGEEEGAEASKGKEITDWRGVWNIGSMTMLEFYPDVLERWQKSNIKDGKITAYDATIGEEKILGEV